MTARPDARVAFRTCPLCEATCGLEIMLEGDGVKLPVPTPLQPTAPTVDPLSGNAELNGIPVTVRASTG